MRLKRESLHFWLPYYACLNLCGLVASLPRTSEPFQSGRDEAYLNLNCYSCTPACAQPWGSPIHHDSSSSSSFYTAPSPNPSPSPPSLSPLQHDFNVMGPSSATIGQSCAAQKAFICIAALEFLYKSNNDFTLSTEQSPSASPYPITFEDENFRPSREGWVGHNYTAIRLICCNVLLCFPCELRGNASVSANQPGKFPKK